MQLNILHVVFLIVGGAGGGALTWVLLKGRIALAEAQGRAAGEIEPE